MGIYFDVDIHGIRWVIYNEDYSIVKSYEKIFEITSIPNIIETRKEYDKLTITEQIIAKFFIYTTLQTTYERPSTYMGWLPYDRDKIHEFFTKDDIIF